MKKLVFATVIVLVACLNAHAIDYGQLMGKKLREALGKDAVKGYTFATYPLDNFGLATAYDGKISPTTELCATWDCLGVSDDQALAAMSADDKLRLKIGGVQYAEIGSGGDLALNEEEKKSLAISALLPKLFQVLSLDASFAHSNDIITTLTLGPVTVRTLRRKQLMDKLNSDSAHPMEKAAWKDGKGNLVLVYSDIVITDAKINIQPNPSTTVDVNAKLDEALQGKVGQVIGQGSSLSFKLDNSTKGNYTFSVNRPLIVAVYAKKQPRSGVLGGTGGWNDWEDVEFGADSRITHEKVELIEEARK